jgi:AcrR family transcriptional regulator
MAAVPDTSQVDVTLLLPPHATSDGTHRRLQEVALRLFADRGYHGVSMREVAAATGVRASSLYGHVSSKEQLLGDLVLLGHQQHLAMLRQSVESAGDGPAAELDAAVRAHVAFHATYRLLATVANNELHAVGPDHVEEVMAVRHAAEQVFLDVISRGIAAGAFDCNDPYLAMAAIGSMGIRVAAWYRESSSYSVDAIGAEYAEFALRLAGYSP